MISSFVPIEGAGIAAKLEALLARQNARDSAGKVDVAVLSDAKDRLARLRAESCVAATLDSLAHIAMALAAADDSSACLEPAWRDLVGELVVASALLLRTEYSALTSHLHHPDHGVDTNERVAVVHAIAMLAVRILGVVLRFPQAGEALLSKSIALATVVASWKEHFSLQPSDILATSPTEDIHLIACGIGGFRKLEAWVLPTPLQTPFRFPCLCDHFCKDLSPMASEQLNICISMLHEHLTALVSKSPAAELQTLCLVQLAKWWGSDQTCAPAAMPFAQAAVLVLKLCQAPVQSNTWVSMLALCQALLDGSFMPGQLCGLALLRDLASRSTSTTLLQVLPTLAPQLLVFQRYLP